ncbi:PglY protein [Pseudonocardia hispaniensis]|uniref:PglY protein n=1 Tax=Pseudonocardia hispaniensis TaxID=904933 RepID=A0ABW1IX95_9PSEU
MSEIYLRDVLDLPEAVHAGDYKVELTGGFTKEATERRVAEYVVTEQLQQAFREALTIVRSALRDKGSHAAYLHGSFGSGKSHFLTVLHAVLNNEPTARGKRGLQPVIAEHDDWLRGKKFLMVPYHLIGATDLDAALLGRYVATVRSLHPDAPVPPVYRSDAMLDDARAQRAFFGDDAEFARWLGAAGPRAADPDDLDDLDLIDGAPTDGWTTAELDTALAAPPGDPRRRALESALLSGPYRGRVRGATGDAEAFLPLENGLSVIAAHTRDLGYDGLILFLDELILWLQAHMSNQEFVNTQVSKLVKLIESGVAERAVPIVSFISRQRDLSKLVGEDVTGADVKNLEAQVEYLAGRFDVVNLADGNLPAIVRERVLKPKPGKEALLDEAFAAIESSRATDRDVLLDATGVTEATWDDFRRVYPLSPALLNVLVALAGALQRERTGLKLLQEMLHRRRADMTLGQLIPLGDLWDVLADGTGEAFTDRLRRDAAAAQRFYARMRAHLLTKYGSENDARFVADDRFVKTLLLAFLAPHLPALTRLTGPRIAALNLGSIRSRTVEPGSMVVARLRDLQAEFGELRSEGDQDPVFSLHLSDLDVEPLLDAVGEKDSLGARRRWVRDRLWEAFGVQDSDEFVCEREFVWRGTRRTAEFVFANVRDTSDMPEAHFEPSVDGRVRVVLDYPFDVPGHFPSDDVSRVEALRRRGLQAPTVVWVPHFLSEQKMAQLGRLLKISYLLERDRLDDYAADLSTDNRIKVRHQLMAQRDNLTSQLVAALAQAYGIARRDPGVVTAELEGDTNVLSLLPGFTPRPAGGATFEHNAQQLVDGLFATLHPNHPDFDPGRTGKALTLADLRTVLGWITRAMDGGERRVEITDRKQIQLVRRVVHGLQLGEVSDGPLHLHAEWRLRIEQHAAAQGITGDLTADDIRGWIAEMGITGLDRAVANLVIATYALLADRAWVHHGAVVEPPDLDRIGVGYALRAQELPSAEEFATARARVADLFGIRARDILVTRNVRALAEEVGAAVTRAEPAVNAVWRALDKHAADLGVELPTPRSTAARHAADLLARLGASREPTALVRALVAAPAEPSDAVVGNAIASAPDVLAALDDVDWALLASVRGLVGHEVLGERAARLAERVAHAARATQLERDLVEALGEIRPVAVALTSELARLAAVAGPVAPTPTVTPPDARPEPSSAPTPEDWRPATVSQRRTGTAAELRAVVQELQTELDAAGPRARYELVWRRLDEQEAERAEPTLDAEGR